MTLLSPYAGVGIWDVKEVLEIANSESNNRRIIRVVCDYYQISEKEIFSKSRQRYCCIARQVAMYLMCRIKKNSLTSIGHLFNKDHTTVIHSRNHISDLMQSLDEIRNDVENLQMKLL